MPKKKNDRLGLYIDVELIKASKKLLISYNEAIEIPVSANQVNALAFKMGVESLLKELEK